MKFELLRDAERPAGWWLLVGGSEQSFVDIDDPSHLEFEYVQMMGDVIETMFPDDLPLRAFHLGGGLCTVPRWLADRYPGSRQRVVEADPEVARIAQSLGPMPRVTVVVGDALRAVERAKPASVDLLVSDVYVGPETVMSVYPQPALVAARTALRPNGLYLCNLSDAAPFALAKTVAGMLRGLYDDVALLAEPAVLRGRRSGNIVLAATDGGLDLAKLARRGAGGPLRIRLVAGDELDAFIGDAEGADDETALPRSGESAVRRLR
ncbi:MAG TPA: fused MFS/spermidine synthase [Mycobacteriales bacterium]|nr:fused MFS/spermidine synthase [Mycobacteriales bacterium]